MHRIRNHKAGNDKKDFHPQPAYAHELFEYISIGDETGIATGEVEQTNHNDRNAADGFYDGEAGGVGFRFGQRG